MKDWLTITCVGILTFGMIGSTWYYQAPKSIVYSCSDKQDHTPEITALCKRLTRGQWWAK